MAGIAPARILVVNAGSSSLKLRLLDAADAVVGGADLAPPAGGANATAVVEAIEALGPIDAVGHRVVHGGTQFTDPVVINAQTLAAMADLTEMAPLHQPKSLAGIEAVTAALPEVPAVAAFDTAFHATMPAAASTYALPASWRKRWGVRKFGFHGLSHAYASRRVAEIMGRVDDPDLRVITCHLGAGASLAAVLGGHSVDTTMGFTPLDGLVMATRSGSVDPGLVLWLVEHEGVAPADIAETLERRSGLLGLAGTADMRAVLDGAQAGQPDARLALEVYLHRLRAAIAAMTASLGGLDAIAFMGGVGERAPVIRALAADGLAYLGIALDPAANGRPGTADREIGVAGVPVQAFVIPAREDIEIARDVRRVVGATA